MLFSGINIFHIGFPDHTPPSEVLITDHFQVSHLFQPVSFTPDAGLKRPEKQRNFPDHPLNHKKIGLILKIFRENVDCDRQSSRF